MGSFSKDRRSSTKSPMVMLFWPTPTSERTSFAPRGGESQSGSALLAAGRDARQRGALVAALDRHPQDEPHTRGVVLLLHNAGVELARLLGEQDVVVGHALDSHGLIPAHHLGLVLRHPGRELLVVLVPDLRIREHDEARFRIVHA